MLILIQTKPEFCFLRFEEMAHVRNQGWTQIGASDWIGFYDVLRTRNGNTIGLRLWPFEWGLVAPALIDSKQLRASDEDICFLFGSMHEWDESMSCDQLFHYAEVVEKGGTHCGILLSFLLLSVDERTALARAVPGLCGPITPPTPK